MCLLATFCLVMSGCKGDKKDMNGVNPTDVENIETSADSSATISQAANDSLENIPYNIPAQRFDETSMALSHASGVEIVSDLTKTGPVKVNAVNGQMNILQAVQTAIKGTPLKIKKVTSCEITVVYNE